MTSVNHVTPSLLTGALQTVLSAGLVPMVWSAPGVGKSHIINNDLVNVYDKIATAIADGRGIKINYAGRQIKGGGKALLVIPPHLAYGKKGSTDSIPPCSTLIFEIELFGIKGS